MRSLQTVRPTTRADRMDATGRTNSANVFAFASSGGVDRDARTVRIAVDVHRRDILTCTTVTSSGTQVIVVASLMIFLMLVFHGLNLKQYICKRRRQLRKR